MNSQNSQLKREVMLRVRFIHLVKRALRPFAVECVVAVAALVGVGKMVFVAKVFENAPSASQVNELSAFFLKAFTNTEASVQLMVLAVAVAVTLALKDLAKSLAMLRTLRLAEV